MNKPLTFGKRMDDFRLERKKLHPIESIMFIKVLAIICNATNWEEIADFGKARKDFLSKYFDLTSGIPSHYTFNWYFSLSTPDKFQQLFIGWLHKLFKIDLEPGNQIAIDGKSSRGTGSRKNKMLKLLNAYITDKQCILGQLKPEAKSNEITAIPKLLDELELNDAEVSIDAIGCQRNIASKILEKNGDYFLAVKQNQKTLYEDIESTFLVFKPTQTNHFLTGEINDSRVERKECKVMENLFHLSEECQWDDLKKIIKIETLTYLKSEDKTKSEMRYYKTRKEDSAEKHLEINRNHWAIENNLHRSLEVVMREDRSRKRINNVAETFFILLKVILKLLREKQTRNKHISIKRMQKVVAYDLDYLQGLLKF